MMRSFPTTHLPRVFSLLAIAVVLSPLVSVPVAAVTYNDLQSIAENTPWYKEGDVSCAVTTITGGATATSNAGATSGSWNSGLQPPYILEQFAIETLKDVAKKRNVDPSSVVTQEHVIALVAFMFGEGGDIVNDDIFNPLNSGINAPELLSTANSPSGLQSYKSFDAGVEATARTIVGSNQSRLADVLTVKDSTAQQFMFALTYYNKYPGNAEWAEASQKNPDTYYQQRLTLVQQVRSQYADIAGLIIGTPQHEQTLNLTDKGKLTYHPSGDTSSGSDKGTSLGSTGGCAGTATGVFSGDIVKTAILFSWPTNHGLTPKPEYAAAIAKYDPKGLTSANGADCGAFVATVMHATGVDPAYPDLGTGSQLAYARQHPEKYSVLDKVTSTADLQPGDILVTVNHTFIFIGAQADGSNQASASQGSRMPSMGQGGGDTVDDMGVTYSRIRVIK